MFHFLLKHHRSQCQFPTYLLHSIHNSITQQTPRKPDNNHNPSVKSLASLLEFYDFTPTQISNMITKYPHLLGSKHDTTLKPKLDFFLSVGFTPSGLTTIISSNPMLLSSSLNNRLKPNFGILSSFIPTAKQITVALRGNSRLLQLKLESNLLPNVRTLQSYGIPDTKITKLVTNNSRVVFLPTDKFKIVVESIKKMGFDPKSAMFVQGVRVMCQMSTETWERKVVLYKSLGFSEEEINTAFIKQPSFMNVSEEKIKKVMEFFVKELQWEPSRVFSCPVVLNLSLEKRVMRRWSVLSVLAAKQLVILNSSAWLFIMSEEVFVDKYVLKYQHHLPEVLKVYSDNQKGL